MDIALETELLHIDEQISVHRSHIERLTGERYKVLAKHQALDMDLVLQFIVDKGLSSGEVMERITSMEVPK